MNLLKITFLVIITASVALLLSSQATALDHPWDDRPTDTTTASNSSENIGNDPDDIGNVDDSDSGDDVFMFRIRFWAYWLFAGIDSYVIGQQVHQVSPKPERGSKYLSGKVAKPDYR